MAATVAMIKRVDITLPFFSKVELVEVVTLRSLAIFTSRYEFENGAVHAPSAAIKSAIVVSQRRYRIATVGAAGK